MATEGLRFKDPLPGAKINGKSNQQRYSGGNNDNVSWMKSSANFDLNLLADISKIVFPHLFCNNPLCRPQVMFNLAAPWNHFITPAATGKRVADRATIRYCMSSLQSYLPAKKNGSEAIIHFIHDCLYVNTRQL